MGGVIEKILEVLSSVHPQSRPGDEIHYMFLGAEAIINYGLGIGMGNGGPSGKKLVVPLLPLAQQLFLGHMITSIVLHVEPIINCCMRMSNF